MSQKLELTWYGKDKPIKPEPRILIKDDKNSNLGKDGTAENMLIHGDNLLALKALEQTYTGKVKCIYIDPPYNTGAAFEHYDDNLEHSTWLSLIKPRLEILRNLLSEDGSIWISIDDDEGHYLKVLCDEIFGRNNFINTVIWHKKGSRSNDAKWFSDNHDFILVYAKNKEAWRPNLLPRTEKSENGYSNPDNDSRGVWISTIMSAKSGSETLLYEIESPSGRKVLPPSGRYWACSKETFEKWKNENRIWFGKDGDSAPRKKTFLSEVKSGLVPLTLWFREEVGDNQEAKKEVKTIDGVSVFPTPKPERLMERIITLASNPNDIVLDSFLGSGTTAAVAHKMGRRWIGIEMGEHAYTHCKVRLDKVISGEDQGGISKAVNWQGGGGYTFYTLAPSLINIDSFGQPVINEEYSPDMLSAAVALHEGFTYKPDDSLFWKQSVSSEKSFLFVTTRHVTAAYLQSIHNTMQEEEYLTIACTSFDSAAAKAYTNITVKKIPQMLLEKCEFGKTGYSLNIVHPPVYEEDDE